MYLAAPLLLTAIDVIFLVIGVGTLALVALAAVIRFVAREVRRR